MVYVLYIQSESGLQSTWLKYHLLEGHNFCDYLYFLHSVFNPDAFQAMQFYSCLYLCKKNEIKKMIKKQRAKTFLSFYQYICTNEKQSKLTNTLNIHFQNGSFIKRIKLCTPWLPYTYKNDLSIGLYTQRTRFTERAARIKPKILITNIIYTRSLFLFSFRLKMKTFHTDVQKSAEVKGFLRSETFPVKSSGLSWIWAAGDVHKIQM